MAAIVGAGDRVKVERGRPSGRQTGGAAVIDAFGARWTLDVSGLDGRAQQTADPDVPYLVSRSLTIASIRRRSGSCVMLHAAGLATDEVLHVV